MISRRIAAIAAFTLAIAPAAFAQVQGPSTASTPYVLPVLPGTETISLLTVDNTGLTPDDVVAKVGGGSYSMVGIPDGMGAFDNGDGSFTLLVNQELGNTSGAVRAHGAAGAFVSKWTILKNSLVVATGEDQMKRVFLWNAATQQSATTSTAFAFNRFCSADLAASTAYYNPATGLGTTERIYLDGEEGGNTGYVLAHVITGVEAGNTYVLGKFNLSTNGSGLTAIGAWENALASPYPQDKTVVIGNNDGGSGIMGNALAVYVGTKTLLGTVADRAGLTNGTLKFVRVTGNAVEIANTTTRTTNIVSGTAFSLSSNSSTTFSRPEDGAWNPLNPSQYFFVTTDQLDQVSDGLGAQVGRTRLWRLTFADITNPDLGGTIDLLIDGQTVNGARVNMFDNIAVNKGSGRMLIQEDVGGAAHNGKIWEYDPATFTGATNSGTLTLLAKHDPARFGDRAAGVTTAATAPFNNDEESSGILEITDIMAGSSLHRGNPAEAWYISSDQAHYTTGITSAQAEGGQMFVLHQIAPLNNVQVSRSGLVRDRRTGRWTQQITITNTAATLLQGPFFILVDGLSANATLATAAGVSATYAPASPYVQVPVAPSGLAAGASATVTLEFTNPSNGAITYSTRTLNSVPTP